MNLLIRKYGLIKTDVIHFTFKEYLIIRLISDKQKCCIWKTGFQLIDASNSEPVFIHNDLMIFMIHDYAHMGPFIDNQFRVCY